MIDLDDNSQYRELFFEETDDHLSQLNDGVLALESEPENREQLDSIFRSAHTLKGMAATMGYDTMAKLTHSMENMFQGFKDGVLAITGDSISLIFDCLDKLAEIVEDIRAEMETDESTISELLTRLSQVNQGGEEPAPGTAVSAPTGLTLSNIHEYLQRISADDRALPAQVIDEETHCYAIGVQLEETCVLKGPRSFIVIDKLEHHGDIIHSDPYIEDLENGEFEDIFYLLYLSQEPTDKIEKSILGNSEIKHTIVKALSESDLLSPETLTVETATKRETMAEAPATIEELKTVTKQDLSPAKKRPENAASSGQQSIRVELNKLDSFMNLVSELVVYRTRLENISNQQEESGIREPLEQVARITTELQDLVLKIRMEQVSVVLKRFPRMVRDLARDLDKEINLVIEGEETELDRTVVSELGEPLIHLLRNSADHGIESKADRMALGKPAAGEIKIIAFQQGNRVVITISDDGKGINPAVIAASAAKKGISTEGMNEQEIRHLIFHPGFSTAATVTNVSGRGVGMDAVHSKISSLGGSIELHSEVNEGTTFVINLPLTLSIIQSLMVKVANETFALPLGVIEKVVEVKPGDLIDIHQQEVYLYQGKAIPVVRTNRALDLPESDPETTQHLILVLLGKKYYALLVDELIGQQEIVIKKLGRELSHLKKYIGATILGNGDITLILDITALCHESSGGLHRGI